MEARLCLALAAACAFGISGCDRASADNKTSSAGGEVMQGPAASNTSNDTNTGGSARRESDAMNALSRMGSYLRTLKAFEIKATVTTEDVLDDGEKVQTSNRVTAVAERPNHLRVELTSDRKRRMYFFDGKTFTVYAPRQQFYATVPAPATIAELSDMLEDKYGINLPLVDLFRWGSAEAPTKDITGAQDLGPAEVNGVTVEQYAFRQPGLDWQVWIQLGEYPLPRKVVLTTTTDEARPQHTAVYDWNLAPSFDASSFEFTPPPEAKKISITEIRAVRNPEPAKGGTKK